MSLPIFWYYENNFSYNYFVWAIHTKSTFWLLKILVLLKI